MSRLLRKTHPHLVLLGFLNRDECKIHHSYEYQHHHEFDVGEISQAMKHGRILIIKVLRGVLIDNDGYDVFRTLHALQFAAKILHIFLRSHPRRSTVDGFGKAEIAMKKNLIGGIGEQHRNGVISLDNAQQEVDLRLRHTALAGARRSKLLGGICPYLHTLAFLPRKVFHQLIAYSQKRRHEQQSHDKNRHLPDASGIVYALNLDIHCSKQKYGCFQPLAPWLTTKL